MAKKPVALIILDGFGLRDTKIGNAVKAANMPNFHRYHGTYPHGTLTAHGEAVGLPEGQMGNSEVGHLNLGAGRIVYQSLTRINVAVRNGEFNTDATIQAAVEQAVKNGKKVHVLGLLSPGGIHSHSSHMEALVEAAKTHGANDVFVHAFLDGRDVLPKSALGFIESMESKLAEIGIGKIATVSGRYFAMDRDKNFDRTQLSYDAMTKGAGAKFATASEGVEESYRNDTLDEFVTPFIVDEKGLIESGDTVIFANFRPDRAQQLAIAFSNPDVLPSLQVEGKAALTPLAGLDVNFVSMMTYGNNVKGPIIFGLQDLANTYGEVIANNGMNQLRVAETEKYAHVTFFFDGGVDKDLPGATRVLINSPQVATYDLKPEMSAYEVAEATVAEINKDIHDTIILNFANPDMVGHTGSMEATVACLEAVDKCLGDVVEAILAKGGYAIITADHGNAEMLINDDGETWTAHTISPVPVIITKQGVEIREGGVLGDLAPTLLDLLGVAQPAEMTGSTLIKAV